MKRAILLPLVLVLAGCAIHKVETSKTLYAKAVRAGEAGNDLEAVLYWKALVEKTDGEIAAGHYLSTNHFLRATARIELGLWDEGFDDLKKIDPATLREEEYWIYPLYLVLQGDYYSAGDMPSVASNFYQAVLRKSSYKTSAVYLLALERDINNSIKTIQRKAAGDPDPDKLKRKEYESLSKDVLKYLEEFPFSSVPHYLMADLQAKMGSTDEAVQHLMAAIELGLPSTDLRRSAEFLLATMASDTRPPLKTALLRKAVRWWSDSESDSILRAGENTAEWLRDRDASFPASETSGTIRWLGVARKDGLRVLLWEAVAPGEASKNMRQSVHEIFS